ncbi:alpha/beta-hydrolase [Delitschia confertaspora ATCC 74209]|uniref:Alpha/beta-hydrolase n=1 Tax=Delitschia confertaspora ATCC 74209 TaxID=1513339 RepID=A0A9P4JHS3_9PLEO|nr:alpha/beta-hydrolase [Delitschia confertaspora ATCC 74209]
MDDTRISSKTAILNGYTYHYLDGTPDTKTPKATVFLIHGWPDLSIGWRNQIPFLLDMGFRVVVPDMLGYGRTDAPKVPPNPVNLYSLKRASDDIAELAKQLGAPKIILGGHDWGGMVVWRAAQWHPELISHVFSVCTPYAPIQKQYLALEDLVKGRLPHFGYQLHLASGEVEEFINSEETIRQFLKGMYGGTGPNGEVLFDPAKGILAENIQKVRDSRLLDEKMLDYYVKEYSRSGIHSTLNWYRTRKANWEEELALVDKNVVSQPTLFIQATHDSVLKPEMSKEMEKYIPNLTRSEVAASHWALIQKPEEVNSILKKWLEGQGFGIRSSL